MKKIMILGAGIYQVPLIQKAKQLGIYTIVVSCKGNYPGFAIADQVYECDTTDCKKILEIAKKEQIDGICTTGTDVAVITIGEVCDALQLTGISHETAKILTDKYLMKECFKMNGVCTADFQLVSNEEQLVLAAKKVGYPLVVKAVDTSGSRGVTIVRERAFLQEAYQSAMTYTKKNYVIVEKFIEGIEIGVDGFVKDHEIIGLYPHEKYVYHTQNVSIPAGHGFPISLTKNQEKSVKLQVQRAIKASKLNQSAFNMDMFLVGDEAYVIELGGRCGATCIPELITLHTQVDYYKLMIENALGKSLTISEAKEVQPVKAMLVFSKKTGVIKRIDEKQIQSLGKEGVEVIIDYKVGQQVEAVKNGTSRIGHVIAKTSSIESLAAYVKIVEDAIEIEKID